MTLFLTNKDTEIPKGQEMQFKEARDGEFPPYLTEFKGTPGERMVENLKVHLPFAPDGRLLTTVCNTDPARGGINSLL